MSRWFRVYDEFLDDPKIQRLHPALLKVLLNVWCVASRNDGRLPTIPDMSFSLRMTEDETFRAVSKLAEAGFIDTDDATGEQRPHGWEARQFRSDSSTDRVRKHRKQQKSANPPDPPPPGKGAHGNGDETLHETPPEQKQNRGSVADATGTVVPHPASDLCKAVFDSGRAILIASGVAERQAGSIVGRWRKALGDAEMILILKQAEIEQPSDPVEWITAAVETRNGKRSRNSDEIRDPVLAEYARRAGMG